jgi:hypothetical protein
VVIILLIALGVHSCQVSATNSALQDYANSVSSLNSQSAANGKSLFTTLAQASSANATNVQNEINQTLTNEKQVLSKAKALSVPDQVKTAHSKFLLALQMRVDGVGNIAKESQPALAGTESQTAANKMPAETARLYGSDVIHKSYAVPELVGAPHAAGTPFSPINGDQFVTNVQWVAVVHRRAPRSRLASWATRSPPSALTASTLRPSTNTVPSSDPHLHAWINGGTNNDQRRA